MDNKEYAKVIANNLRRIMFDHNKTQADVSRDLQISKATLSSWMNGTRIPRMNNIDMLCHYFNVSRAEIMEKEIEVQTLGQQKEYYDDETLAFAQALRDNPDLRALMKAAMDVPKESQTSLTQLLYSLKETNPNG